MLYRNWFEHETCLRMYSLKWNISSPLKCPLLEKLCMNLGGIRFKDIILFNLSIFLNLIPYAFLLIPQLPDMVQKCFCTLDGAMDPTFQIEYIPSRFMFNLMDDHKKSQFFRHPLVQR